MAILIGILITVLFVAPFTLSGIVRMAQTRDESRRIADLEINGALVDGTVTDFDIRPVKGGVICSVSYSYEVEGKSYQQTQEVGKDHILTRGASVKVLCLPRSPQVAMLTQDDRDDARRSRTSGLAIFFFTLAIILLILIPIMVSIASASSSPR